MGPRGGLRILNTPYITLIYNIFDMGIAHNVQEYGMTEESDYADVPKFRLAIYRKVNAMRADVLKADWRPDKFYVIKKENTRVDYVSVGKMKANLNPIFAAHGVDYDLDFGEPIPVGTSGSHFIVPLKVMMVDIETGAWCVDRVNGEAIDMGDKAVGKAQSYAMKQWLSNRFMISDGSDPERGDTQEIPTFSKPKPKTEDDAQSQTLGTEEDKKEVPEEKPRKTKAKKEEPKVPEETETAEDGTTHPLSVEDATKHLPDVLNTPQVKMIVNTVTKARQMFDKGLIAQAAYDQVADAARAVKGPGDGMAFIQKYREEYK